ncbi:free fatty acid receptor 3-like [Girardinichthys multiradiatus]|uniref:free fatty acid receptor 3-like n=1 Tax=Girardinichthys multiradiatus TaxID=208333 RepID=UPI001FAB4140|nr:free fatty acid receptor 3-like [Girardinichthys multiradiatus]XP_047239364.1 free fatty acid receptor 3-like [Girardinichthys multiradiatus]XP_047240297.1 free fatty acid receptor 3-like [Girardinichthys multiradiatus]
MFYSRLLLSVYILTFLFGVPANILSFITLCRKVFRKGVPIDVLLLNLTISDLIFLAFLPFKMKEAYDNMAWLLPYSLCPLTGFIFYVTIYNSTLLLTAVSVERYLGVAFPLRYSVCRRPRYAMWACFTFWVLTSCNLSIVYVLPYSQWSYGSNTSSPVQPPPTCYLNFSKAELEILLPVRLELFLVLFCIPFIISCFCYVNFILILSRLPSISRRRRLRCIGLALGTLIVFTVCFVPYNASHVVGFAQQESQEWRNLALLSSTLNACLDPFIFYLSSAAVRSMLNRCFRRITAKMHILGCAHPGTPHRLQHQLSRCENYKAEAPP